MNLLPPDNLDFDSTGAETKWPLSWIEARPPEGEVGIQSEAPTGATTFKIHFNNTPTDRFIPADDLAPPVILKSDIIKTLFELFSSKWKNETANQSSIRRIKDNENYRLIVELGEDVIPFILADMVSGAQPAFWFPALKEIAGGEDPVPPEYRGNVPEMTRAWIEWSQKRLFKHVRPT